MEILDLKTKALFWVNNKWEQMSHMACLYEVISDRYHEFFS